MVKVERMIETPYGDLQKDNRKLSFGQSFDLPDHNIRFDLCAAIEHIGHTNSGHYFCAKRNFVAIDPFLVDKEPGRASFKLTNWNLISDERKPC